MSTLVKRRAEIIEHGGAEKKHGAAGGGVDSTMLEMERQHKAKILEATKRRMYEELWAAAMLAALLPARYPALRSCLDA